MKNVTLRQLRIFASVARQLSFSRAGQELGLTQPAVSIQIRLLEQAAGMVLIERAGRRLALTEAGRELLSCAAGVSQLIESTSERMDSLRGMTSGVLKLGAVVTASYFAPSALAQFTLEHPAITVRFSVGTMSEIFEQLVRGDLELVILGKNVRDTSLVPMPFAKHPIVVIAAPDHPLAKHRRISLARLAEERILCREQGSGIRSAVEHLFHQHRLPFMPAMDVNNNEPIKQAAMAGFGIGFVSMHSVGSELRSKSLVTLAARDFPIMSDWNVVSVRERPLSPTATAFRDYLIRNGETVIERATGISAAAGKRGRM